MNTKRKNSLLIVTLMLASVLSSQAAKAADTKAGSPRVAIAKLLPTEGSKVTGQVSFREDNGAVIVEVEASGLSPGQHGFHVHEFGDCSSADGSSAGNHFALHGHPHAGPTSEARHVGDLGNVTADAKGIVKETITDRTITLKGESSIIGRSVIIHEKMDDLVSQPAGNAGKRLTCGVIGISPKS